MAGQDINVNDQEEEMPVENDLEEEVDPPVDIIDDLEEDPEEPSLPEGDSIDIDLGEDLELNNLDKEKKRKKKDLPKEPKDKTIYYKELGKIYRSPIRKVLNMFSVNLSSGIGVTKYKQFLDNVTFVQQGGSNLQFINGSQETPVGTIHQGFSSWFNQPGFVQATPDENLFPTPAPYLVNPVNNSLIADRTLVFDGDSDLQFKSYSFGVPLLLSLHFNFKNFRLGAGMSYEFQKVAAFKPTAHKELINEYKPNIATVTNKRQFLLLGYKFYDYWDYSFAGEIAFGKFKAPNKKFDNSLIDRSLFWNIGVSIEKNLSEYFRLILKPNLEFKNYKLNLPNGSAQMKTRYPSLFINLGVSYNFPEIPRSPIKEDHTQLKHVITNRLRGKRIEVRGQPFYKEQNPKVGQNHRRLIKYKGKNKRKLNPY